MAREQAPPTNAGTMPASVKTRLRLFDPFHSLWRLFTSVRFAIYLIAFLASAGLLGVVLPQVPPNIRDADNPAEVARWLDAQEGKFGPFTDLMHRLGLFQVFDTPWFTAGVAVLVVSVTVCVASRFPAVWRIVRRPQRQAPAAYFERAKHRAEFTAPAEPRSLEAALSRRWYKVERFQEAEAVYLFADRFPWASLGTFVSHLALIIFIAAAVVSQLTSFNAQLFVAEGASVPVFSVGEQRQIQVYLEDAVGRFDAKGRPTDYRSQLVIYDQGREAKRCTSTVNDPCTYDGYRFSQAAYYGFGAGIQVKDTRSGNVVYKETLALFDNMPSPRVLVRDTAGRVLLEETIAMDGQVEDSFGRIVELPDGSGRFWMGVRPREDDWDLIVFGLDSQDGARLTLSKGQRATAGGLDFEYSGLARNPARIVSDIPVSGGGNETVMAQMGNAVYGAVESSSGEAVDLAYVDPGQPPRLYLSGASLNLDGLAPGESVVRGTYEYTFLGQREFAGIQAKQDRSDTLIWVATGLLLFGLGVTFYVPRRRLWVRLEGGRAYLAGIAGHMVNFGKEMREIGAEAGSPDALAEHESEER